jgi:cytochrome c553
VIRGSVIILVICMSASITALPGSAPGAGDIGAGREKSIMCVRCHGPEGISRNPRIPHLAGQDPDYLVYQLRSYRSRERRGTAMQDVARRLSDEDIENLAAYYHSLELP